MTDVIETSNIIKTTDGVEADGIKLDPNSYVSMNCWGFPAKEGVKLVYLDVLEKDFIKFYEEIVPDNPLKAEYLIPIHIGKC